MHAHPNVPTVVYRQMYGLSLAADQTWLVWPTDTDMSTFTSSGQAASVVSIITSTLFGAIRQKLTDLQLSIRASQTKLVQQFNSLQAILDDYEKSAKLDAGFVGCVDA